MKKQKDRRWKRGIRYQVEVEATFEACLGAVEAMLLKTRIMADDVCFQVSIVNNLFLITNKVSLRTFDPMHLGVSKLMVCCHEILLEFKILQKSHFIFKEHR